VSAHLATISGFSIGGTIEKDGGCAAAGSLRSDRRPTSPQAHRKRKEKLKREKSRANKRKIFKRRGREKMEMTDRKLLGMAADAMTNSYSPYSRFKIGAAIECMDGSVYMGCNMENAAVGSTVCAETAAIAAAVAAGQRNFKRIAIISEGSSYCYPCGACRQLLAEFSPDVEVLCARSDGRYVSYPLGTLLPMAFGKDHLGKS